jgi:hypothetical protein
MLAGYKNPTRVSEVNSSQSERERIIFEGIYTSISPSTGEVLLSEIEEKVIDSLTVSTNLFSYIAGN